MGERFAKIKKVRDRPSPGDYDTTLAFKKTQTINQIYRFPEQEYECFTDEQARIRKKMPGPANYKYDATVFKKISISPRSIAIKRH